ncbi:MAG: hypothetical protein U9Q58_01125, partial [Pseudomonadota bacterium]|nr:hypothetical protein [Pseudomonadota bacterium]
SKEREMTQRKICGKRLGWMSKYGIKPASNPYRIRIQPSFKVIVNLLLLIGGIIGVLCTVCLLAGLKGCRERPLVKKTQIIRVAPDKYEVLVEVWNKRVNSANLGEEFYLKQLDPEDTVNRLNNFFEPFFAQFTQEIKDEFIALQHEDKYSLFILYNNFLHRYNDHQKKTISTNMSGVEVKELLYKLTKNDTLDNKTIQIVAAIQNPCLFLKIFKRDLYRQGLDSRIKTCSDLKIDKDKYPFIHALLVKNVVK